MKPKSIQIRNSLQMLASCSQLVKELLDRTEYNIKDLFSNDIINSGSDNIFIPKATGGFRPPCDHFLGVHAKFITWFDGLYIRTNSHPRSCKAIIICGIQNGNYVAKMIY